MSANNITTYVLIAFFTIAVYGGIVLIASDNADKLDTESLQDYVDLDRKLTTEFGMNLSNYNLTTSTNSTLYYRETTFDENTDDSIAFFREYLETKAQIDSFRKMLGSPQKALDLFISGFFFIDPEDVKFWRILVSSLIGFLVVIAVAAGIINRRLTRT